ncbi:MAG TPA: hypothetical protein VFE13_19085 [Caulobacteraceae bacterium]|jgi:hypothetical protein|nr:hypothetical protein [Caulobacteraceae bacterium]
MRTFNLFIEDDRYTVPTLAFVTARDKRAALRLAMRRLEESPHHLCVEVCEGDDFLGHVARNWREASEA